MNKNKSQILILTRHPLAGRLLSAKLSNDLHCETVLVNSLAQASDVLTQSGRRFSVAVCELSIPDGTAEHVVEMMKGAAIPVIAIASVYSEELSESLFKSGVVDFVLKDSPNVMQYVSDLVHRIIVNAKTKVLLVDDSNTWRQVLKFYLLQQNLQVLTANDADQALQILEQHPDTKLMITDFEMPKINGDELVFEVRKKFNKGELAIIGISGSSDGKISARFLKSGANDFINKPFFYEEIFCRVSQNLEMIELIESNQNAATRDFLTGLYNRRYFFDKGEKALKVCIEKKHALALAIIDIDHFKNVNDQFGHDWGDLALKNTAQQMNQFFSGDLCARLGGEEFALLFTDKTEQQIAQDLEAFRALQEHHPLMYLDGRLIEVKVSIGWVMLETVDAPLKLNELIKLADVKLYQAKHKGRNRIEL